MNRYNPDYTIKKTMMSATATNTHRLPSGGGGDKTRENLAELIGTGERSNGTDKCFKNEGIKPEWEDQIIKRGNKTH